MVAVPPLGRADDVAAPGRARDRQRRQGARDHRDPRRRIRRAARRLGGHGRYHDVRLPARPSGCDRGHGRPDPGPGRSARRRGDRRRRSKPTPASRRTRSHVALGVPAISDDTGLEVDALDGAPGVYSARYAGEHATYADNVDKLLVLDGCTRRPQRALRDRRDGALARRSGDRGARRGRGRDRDGRRGDGADSATTRCSCPTEGRRPHVCGDEPGREACVVTSRASVRARSPRRSLEPGE